MTCVFMALLLLLQNGMMPLMCAALGGHLAVVQYLQSRGASLTDTDNVSTRELSLQHD